MQKCYGFLHPTATSLPSILPRRLQKCFRTNIMLNQVNNTIKVAILSMYLCHLPPSPTHCDKYPPTATTNAPLPPLSCHLKFASRPGINGATTVAIAAKMVSPMIGLLPLSFILPWVDCFASLVLSLGNGQANLSRFLVACGYFRLIVTFRLITSPHAFFPSL